MQMRTQRDKMLRGTDLKKNRKSMIGVCRVDLDIKYCVLALQSDIYGPPVFLLEHFLQGSARSEMYVSNNQQQMERIQQPLLIL